MAIVLKSVEDECCFLHISSIFEELRVTLDPHLPIMVDI
jgi:hypothetical protein